MKGFPVKGLNGSQVDKKTLSYSDVYLDVMRQFLAMNLYARRLWHTDSCFRETMEGIHRGHEKLINSKEIRELGITGIIDRFSGQEPSKLDVEDAVREHYLDLKGGSSRYTISSDYKKQERRGSRLCLRAICNYLDYKNYDNEKCSNEIVKNEKLIEFLIEFFGELVPVKSSKKYGHENLYLSLYFLDETLDFCLFQEKKDSVDEMVDVAEWIERFTYYFSKSGQKKVLVEDVFFDPKNYFVQVPLNKSVFDYLVKGSGTKDVNYVVKAAIERFEGLLLGLIAGDELQCIDVRDPANKWSMWEKDLYRQRQAKDEYRGYLKFRKTINIEGIYNISRIDVIQSTVYAILAYDYYKGVYSKVGSKRTIEESISVVIEKMLLQGKKNLPRAGVKKQLNAFLKLVQINSDTQQGIIGVENFPASYFYYPLFQGDEFSS